MVQRVAINDAFRMAGYPFGRPGQELPEGYDAVFPADFRNLSELFSDSVVDRLVAEAGQSEGAVYYLAAEILEFTTRAGFSTEGRRLDIGGITVGAATYAFEPEIALQNDIARRVRLLRAKGLAVQSETENLAESFLREAITEGISEHAALPNVHHTPPAAGTSGITQQDVDDAIATHAGMPNVHHTPPAAGTSGITQQDVDDAIETAVDAHAAMANIHHTPTAEGVSESAMDTAIAAAVATHAGMPNVHHTPPAAGGSVTNYIPGIAPQTFYGSSLSDAVAQRNNYHQDGAEANIQAYVDILSNQVSPTPGGVRVTLDESTAAGAAGNGWTIQIVNSTYNFDPRAEVDATNMRIRVWYSTQFTGSIGMLQAFQNANGVSGEYINGLSDDDNDNVRFTAVSSYNGLVFANGVDAGGNTQPDWIASYNDNNHYISLVYPDGGRLINRWQVRKEGAWDTQNIIVESGIQPLPVWTMGSTYPKGQSVIHDTDGPTEVGLWIYSGHSALPPADDNAAFYSDGDSAPSYANGWYQVSAAGLLYDLGFNAGNLTLFRRGQAPEVLELGDRPWTRLQASQSHGKLGEGAWIDTDPDSGYDNLLEWTNSNINAATFGSAAAVLPDGWNEVWIRGRYLQPTLLINAPDANGNIVSEGHELAIGQNTDTYVRVDITILANRHIQTRRFGGPTGQDDYYDVWYK